MVELEPNELELLERIAEKVELRALFFQKADHSKWFYALADGGYFAPESFPPTSVPDGDGYVRIPVWEPIEYLLKISKKSGEYEKQLHKEILEIIRSVTNYAKENNISNYQVWWRFAEITSNISVDLLGDEDVSNISYWLSDRYGGDLVSSIVVDKLLKNIISSDSSIARSLLRNMIHVLFLVKVEKLEVQKKNKAVVSIAIDKDAARKVIVEYGEKIGEILGKEISDFLIAQLCTVLEAKGNDQWSSVWRPAIEDHEQNHRDNDEASIIISLLREVLLGNAFVLNGRDVNRLVKRLFSNEYETVQRLAIFLSCRIFEKVRGVTSHILHGNYFRSNFRHELWWFLYKNYPKFNALERLALLDVIQLLERRDENDNLLSGATGYERATWLAAIKDHGPNEADLYARYIEQAGVEPEHPDFSSYITTRTGGRSSPFSFDELSSLNVDDLVFKLNNYEPEDSWDAPGIWGLSRVVKDVIKAQPVSYAAELPKFVDLDLAYVHKVIEAFAELWDEKSKLPWDSLWSILLNYFQELIARDSFWAKENEQERSEFVASRPWVVSQIGRFLEAGCKSDDHALPRRCHEQVENILAQMLAKQPADEFAPNSDAMSIAINSPRGHLLEALINLALRSCRLARKEGSEKDSLNVWEQFSPHFDGELNSNRSFEFVTLVAAYIPNFLYMSRPWVHKNLDRIFDKNDHLRWCCAMQGYCYVSDVYEEVYRYLLNEGHFLKALDDEDLSRKVSEKIIQNATIAYFAGFETSGDGDDLISCILARWRVDEIRHLVWFIWTRRQSKNKNVKSCALDLWPRLVKKIDFSSKQQLSIASALCMWTAYLDKIDQSDKERLLLIAPYANIDHNSYEFLSNLARLSATSPVEVYEVWRLFLDHAHADYPVEAVEQMLVNIRKIPENGKVFASDIVSTYLAAGVNRPYNILKDMGAG